PSTPLAFLVACPEPEKEPADCFRRDHPVRKLLGVFAIDLDAFDGVVQYFPAFEVELALQVDLDESAAVRLLRLVELLPAEPASVLAVEKHVEGPPDATTDPGPVWIFD